MAGSNPILEFGTLQNKTFSEARSMHATVEEIENAVTCLSRKDLARFRAWYDEFEAKVWDRQFDADAKEGRLDKIADQAIEDFRKGLCTKL